MLVCAPFHSIANAPVGMAYLAGWLEANGIPAPMRDLNIEARAHLLAATADGDDAEVVPELFALARRTYLAEALVWSWLHPEGPEGLVTQVLGWPDRIQRDFWIRQGIERLTADPALVRTGAQLRRWLDERAAELAMAGSWLGFSITVTNLAATLYLLREVHRRNPDLFTVAGGPHVTSRSAGPLLRAAPGLGAAVPLPGYGPLQALLRARQAGETGMVPGVWQRLGDRVEGDPRRIEVPLDEIPPALWSGLPMRLYESGFQMTGSQEDLAPFYPTVPIETTRGCSYSRCSFCHNVVDYMKYRMRHPDRVIGEILHQMDTVGSRGFFFTDDEFGGSERQVERLCSVIGQLGVRWFCWVRLDSIDRPFLERVYGAGARQLFIGAEAIDDALLDAMHKGYGAREAVARLQVLHEFWLDHQDFLYTFNLIANHPTETVDSVRNTLAVVSEHPDLFLGRLAACCCYHLYEATPDFRSFGSQARPCLDPVLPPGMELPSFRWLLPQHDPETLPRRLAIWDAIGDFSRFRGRSAGIAREEILYD
jgi:hypothetical protein